MKGFEIAHNESDTGSGNASRPTNLLRHATSTHLPLKGEVDIHEQMQSSDCLSEGLFNI